MGDEGKPKRGSQSSMFDAPETFTLDPVAARRLARIGLWPADEVPAEQAPAEQADARAWKSKDAQLELAQDVGASPFPASDYTKTKSPKTNRAKTRARSSDRGGLPGDDQEPISSTRRGSTQKSPTNITPPNSRRQSANPVSAHAGHRGRLRERLLKGGAQSMADYELLEMVLFAAIPRGDTKPLAKALIAKFGTFAEVLHAPEARLREVKGVGSAVIAQFKLLQATAIRTLSQDIQEQPLLSSWKSVLDYCRAQIAFAPVESFHILFLDKRNRLIADERQQTGTVDHTPVYIREVVKRALEVSASAIVLVHNHPSGDPSPSRADVDMTNQIIAAGKPMGIIVHDHIIVARDGYSSFRNLGLIR